eukprot:7365266-Lingulodinium_polyedra.AAC.1
MVHTESMPYAEIRQVEVFRSLIFRHPDYVVSNREVAGLQDTIDAADYSHAAAKKESKTKDTKSTRGKYDKDFLEKHPAIASALGEDKESHKAACSSKGAPSQTQPLPAEDESSDDEGALQEFFNEMEKKRPDKEGMRATRLTDFQFAPRANGDSWQGQVVRHSRAQKWVRDEAKLQQTMSFSIPKLGYDVARIFSEAWAERMQYLYDSHKAGLLSSPLQVQTTMEAMEEPKAFQDVMKDATGFERDQGERIRRILVG